jgi:ABC-type sugar transport system ATPase subunit
MGERPFLGVREVSRRFGRNLVLEDVSLDFEEGSCTALLGENGAGKSTLLKIVSGQLGPSAGHLLIDGEPVRFRSAREARAAGIVVIPQELAYAPRMTVAENLMIGRWPTVAGVTSRRRVEAAAARLLERTGFDLELSRPMTELPLADRQLVEIVKVTAGEARLILLDEPTASLTDAEAQRLFGILEELRRQGTSLVYVSHRLDECLSISDRFAVLRSGRLVRTARRGEVDGGVLVDAMLGEAIEEAERTRPAPPHAAGERRLRMRDWTQGDAGVRDFSLEVDRGEIVVLFGLLGSGVEAIGRALGGTGEPMRGELEVDGRPLPIFRSPREAWRAGVAYVPAERKRDGLVLGQSIHANLALHDPPSRLGFIRERFERRWADRVADEWRVAHAGVDAAVGELSGGNQQKVLLAGRLVGDPRVLVVHEPTRGVDIRARLELHERIRAAAAAGAAVVAITSDVDEALGLGHRVVAVRAGRVVAELREDAMTASGVLSAAAGGGEVAWAA